MLPQGVWHQAECAASRGLIGRRERRGYLWVGKTVSHVWNYNSLGYRSPQLDVTSKITRVIVTSDGSIVPFSPILQAGLPKAKDCHLE